MKRMPCKYPDCGDRRVHHEMPDVSRGTKYIDVPDNVTELDPVFCSYSCAIMDGWSTVTYQSPDEEKQRKDAWRKMNELRVK